MSTHALALFPLPDDFDAVRLLHHIAHQAPKKAVVVWVDENDVPHVSYSDETGEGVATVEVVGLLHIAAAYMCNGTYCE